ncbi:MAG: M13 family metallopeptidase [Bryobacteraceae bacterium]
MSRVLLLSAALSAILAAQKSGIDVEGIDRTCAPCDDFYKFANGKWLSTNPIPAEFSRWSKFEVLSKANRENLRAILEQASSDKRAPRGSNMARIGNFYAACMDTDAIRALGVKPLQEAWKPILTVQDRPSLLRAMWSLDAQSFDLPIRVRVSADYKDSKTNIAHLVPGGLSLPDRDYYTRKDAKSESIRAEFVKYMAKMFVLAGEPSEKAAAITQRVMALETKLAEATLTNVARRDPYARYHILTVEELARTAPNFDWKGYLASANVAAAAKINLMEPELAKEFSRQLESAPLDDWKDYLRWRVLDELAPAMSDDFVRENFAFDQTVLRGVKEMQPRWERCVNSVNSSLGEALGEVYVKKHFPGDAKRRMSELIENLRAAFDESFQNLEWMSDATREQARTKLKAFVAKIGYPDKFRDYSSVSPDPKAHVKNLMAAHGFERKRNLSQVNMPVDRNEWRMTPPTVNAYYSSLSNEIVFPAGILQPPMFVLDSDDARNYGAIGAVIGHEMGHGFDDQGSKFAADGNLKNWWTPEDRKKFEERAGCIVDQFDSFEGIPGVKHNGKLVTGEALGDLGGLTIAYRAYRRSLGGKEAPVIDGFTGDQRFFLSFAQVWGGAIRDEAARLRLQTDPHPLGRYRAIGTLQNMPEFHRAFQCKLGDAMVRPVEKQCKLW